jgi:hypothetical protein
MKIVNKFDEEEGRLLFWVDGIIGGPVIYADTVEEGEALVQKLVEFGAFAEDVINIKMLGKEILDYVEKYKGTNKYNDILLAIEFGYHLKEKEYETNNL